MGFREISYEYAKDTFAIFTGYPQNIEDIQRTVLRHLNVPREIPQIFIIFRISHIEYFNVPKSSHELPEYGIYLKYCMNITAIFIGYPKKNPLLTRSV